MRGSKNTPCSPAALQPLPPVPTYVVRPKALPISEADVSESLVQKLATKPSRSSARGSLLSSKLASSAHARPAAPEPQTLPGPRRPLRFSAIPSASFCFRRTLVTAEPCNDVHVITRGQGCPSQRHRISHARDKRPKIVSSMCEAYAHVDRYMGHSYHTRGSASTHPQ